MAFSFVPGLNGWAIIAHVIINIKGLLYDQILGAEVAAFDQDELGWLAGAGVNALDAHGLALVLEGRGDDLIEAGGAVNHGNAAAFLESIGGKTKDVVQIGGVLVASEVGFAVGIGGAVADLKEGWVDGDEVVATLIDGVFLAQVVKGKMEAFLVDAVARLA